MTAFPDQERKLRHLLIRLKAAAQGAQDSLLLLVSCAAGILFGSLLNTADMVPRHPELSILEIFAHNVSVALVASLLTSYVALPVFIFNAFFLGLNLWAFAALKGIPELLSLSAVHVPLEMLAWIVTLSVSRKITGGYRHALQRFLGRSRDEGQQKTEIRQSMGQAARSALFALGVYCAAAVAEYWEIIAYGGGQWKAEQ